MSPRRNPCFLGEQWKGTWSIRTADRERTAIRVIYTIGHSTRTAEVFLDLLAAHGIQQLADVRTIPRSARHPHFAGDALASFLAARGVTYRHFPGLGGLRKPRPDSVNTAWQNEAFRGYADHMDSDPFGRRSMNSNASPPRRRR